MSHFNRPKTGESECKHSINADKIIVKPNNENPIQYRLPKRNCSEYDVLELPSGYNIKIVLHSSWGDRFFIGLNGIQFYD